MKARRAGGALPLICLLLAGCPRFQEGPVDFWGKQGYVQLGKERIYVHDRGRGPAILLIHGYGAAHDNWIPLLGELARSHRVLAVDLPGFGRSDKYPGDYSPSSLAGKLAQVLDQKGVREAHVVAHSWGTSIALALTLEQPARVRSLTLISAWLYEEKLPPFFIWARAPGVGEALFALFYKERADDRMALAFHDPEPFTHPKVMDLVRTALNRPGAVAAALAAARGQRFTEMEKRYRTIAQPALLIWGAQDRISRVKVGQRLVGELRDARLKVIERCGHIPMLEQPNQVLRAIREFLPREAPPPGSGATSSAPARRQGEARP
jgi:pimeloyl-ACP methyl ester carboxylesterase